MQPKKNINQIEENSQHQFYAESAVPKREGFFLFIFNIKGNTEHSARANSQPDVQEIDSNSDKVNFCTLLFRDYSKLNLSVSDNHQRVAVKYIQH
jgi:hypothetical protein